MNLHVLWTTACDVGCFAHFITPLCGCSHNGFDASFSTHTAANPHAGPECSINNAQS